MRTCAGHSTHAKVREQLFRFSPSAMGSRDAIQVTKLVWQLHLPSELPCQLNCNALCVDMLGTS